MIGLLVRLLIILLVVAGLVGPGRDYTNYALWWVSNGQAPEVELLGPPGPVRGALVVGVDTAPTGRVDLLAAELDGRELTPSPSLRIDTEALPDGEHMLTVRAQDRSLRRNTASANLRFSSDNTPPRFEVQSNPSSVGQGGAVVVHIRPNEPADVQASLGGARLRLYPTGVEYWAVVGVDPEEKPGQREVVVEGRDQVGNTGRSSSQVEVKATTFTRDALQVPSAMLPLLAPAVRAAEDDSLKSVYQRDNGPPLWSGPFLLPISGRVSTEFGELRTYNGSPFAGYHGGTDFQASLGAPVQAPARGRVALREELKLRGRVLVLDHGGGVYTTYGHLSEWLVDLNQEVQQSQPIAKVGSSGLSTGPHLHWELWVGGKNVNPIEWTEREVP